MNIKGLPMTVITESRGIKPEGKFAIHHIIPCCFKCNSFKGRLHIHTLCEIFFSSCNTLYTVIAEYPSKDKTIKNYNRLTASLGSHCIFWCIKKRRKVKATSIINPVYRTVLMTEGLTQILEVVKNRN